jgi:hypothetical protein
MKVFERATSRIMLVAGLGLVYLFLYTFFLKEKQNLCLPAGLNGYVTSCDLYAMYLAVCIPIVLIALIISSRKLFAVWQSFTFIYLVIYLVIYLLAPVEVPDFINFYKEAVALVAFILYPILSFVVIGIAFIKQKKSQ